MAVGDKTTVFQETRALIESVFGRQGFFVNFFKQIAKIFGIEDPLKVVITGIRWLTRQFDRLIKFLESPAVQGIVDLAQKAVQGVVSFFTNLSNNISNITKEADNWDPSKIQEAIKRVGDDVRAFIRNVGKSFRELDIKQQGNFVLEIVGTLIEEVARTIGAVISEGIKTVFSGKGLGAITALIGVINKGLTGFFSEIFGEGAGSVLGTVVTGGVALAFGKKILLGVVAFGARLIATLPGGSALNALIGRRLRTATTSFVGSITGALGSLGRNIARQLRRVPILGNLVPSRWTRGPSEAARRGMSSVFEKAVVTYLRAIQRCVCMPGFGRGGGGGGAGPDFGGDTPQSRRERVKTGRGPTGPGMPRRAPLTSVDTANPYAYSSGAYLPRPDVRKSYLASRRESARNILGRGSSSRALEMYTESLRGPFDDLDADQRGLMASQNAERSGQKVADRYNRRYGGRARMGRFMRGARGFGKGALIAGGITALGVGAMHMSGGGAAQASEFDPETGEPIQTPKQQQMAGIGNVLSGGLEGAMTGAMLGSFIPGIGTAAGAAIGGVIGGVLPLLDEGTRKGVSSFVSGIGRSLQDAGKGISDAAGRGINWIKDGFSSIRKWFSDIDWKTILINALVPGGQFTIQGLQGIADFASKLNVFDGIKSGIDAITEIVEGIRDSLPGWLGGRREVGGPVTRGMPFLVGERGPELFMPSGDGSIASNLALSQMANNRGPSTPSVSANFNVTFNIDGGLNANNIESLRAPILGIIEDAWNEVASAPTRGAII
jgi:hypothetical protein